MNPKTILLVEDNSSDIDLTKRAFEKASILHQLIVAENGQEALDYVQGNGKYSDRDAYQLPSLILLDIKLPGMNGFEILKIIRENPSTKQLPVAILTSSNTESDIVLGYNLGVNSYILKPVDYYEFIEAVQCLCQYWLVLNQTPKAG